MLSRLGLLVIFDSKVGGVQKVQNLDYVIHGRSLTVNRGIITVKCMQSNILFIRAMVFSKKHMKESTFPNKKPWSAIGLKFYVENWLWNPP